MKKTVLLFIAFAITFCGFANEIVIDNANSDIEDNLFFTNKTEKDVHLDITVKLDATSSRSETMAVMIPANTRKYKIDSDFNRDFRYYEQITVKSIGNISSYDYNTKHDDLNFTILEYSAPASFPKYENYMDIINYQSGEVAEDYIKITNMSSENVSYAIYADTKKESNVFLCQGTISANTSVDAFSMESYSDKYGKMTAFKLYTEEKHDDISYVISSNDLKISIK